MNHLRTVLALAAMLVCILGAPAARAQQVRSRVENAEIVYVEGNVVVMKLTNGEVRQFDIADSSRFTIENTVVSVRELKPGMKLTAMITTASTPRWVDTVEIIQVGTVWKTVGTSMIVTTPEGKNKMYRVPTGGKITVDGIDKTLDQLHEGDKITATVVKTRTEPGAGGGASAVVLRAPPTPARVGVLLIDEGAKPIDEGAKPGEPSGMWGAPAIIFFILVILLVTALILLASRRKRKV